MRRITWLGLVIGVLWLQFGLRSHHITIQDAYIDEGFHLVRASIALDFDKHMGDYGYGKILLYYWFGWFEANPSIYLFTARLGMAIWSLLTGAIIFRLGTLLHSPAAGLLAMLLYAVMPYAIFYERMAMADPFAATLAATLIWFSLPFARHHDKSPPRKIREGLMLGLIIGLMLLAKLTTAIMPFVVPLVAILLYPWERSKWRAQVREWAKTYLPSLILGAIITILIWLPLILPAYLRQNTDNAVVVVDQTARRGTEGPSIPLYVERLMPLLYEFATRELLFASAATVIGVGLAGLLWRGLRPLSRVMLILTLWATALALMPILTANLSTTRYFMPLMVPLCLAWGGILSGLPRVGPVGKLASAIAAVGLVYWGLTFAAPFIQTNLTDPYQLNFTSTNRIEHQLGYFQSDDAVRAAAADLNAIQPDPKHIYAPWNLCHLLFFHVDQPVTCTDRVRPVRHIREILPQELATDEIAYVAMADYSEMFFRRVEGLGGTLISTYERPRIHRPVTVWQIRWTTPPNTAP